MDGTTSLWLFNVFVVGMLAWFYYYFYTMFYAIADMNDQIIAMLQKTEAEGHEEGQTKLSDFIEEE